MYKVTSVLFLVFISLISISMLLNMGKYFYDHFNRRFSDNGKSHATALFDENEQPQISLASDKNETQYGLFNNLRNISYKIDTGINRIESVYNERFICKQNFINVHGLFQHILCRKTVEDVDHEKMVIQDKYGRLHFPFAKMDIKPQTDKLIDFASFVEQNVSPFLYVQYPSKINPLEENLPIGISDYSNATIGELIHSLKSNDISILDIRNEMLEAEMDWNSAFYRTDHHWTIETAFWACSRIIEHLDKEFSLSLDSNSFFRNKDHYILRKCDFMFLGTQGSRVGWYYAGSDDFYYYVPEFDTDFCVEIKHSPYEIEQLGYDEYEKTEGTFESAIMRKKFIENKYPTSIVRYNIYLGNNYPEVRITNRRNNNYHIFIIQDSYGMPVSPLLSLSAHQITVIDLRSFSGSLRKMLMETKPDLVIIAYNPSIFSDDRMFDKLAQ